MNTPQFESQLAWLGITFHWYEIRKFWWVSKIRPDGKTTRSNPAGAESREAAETAAKKLIRRQFSDNVRANKNNPIKKFG
jgi:hypothetical protein